MQGVVGSVNNKMHCRTQRIALGRRRETTVRRWRVQRVDCGIFPGPRRLGGIPQGRIAGNKKPACAGLIC